MFRQDTGLLAASGIRSKIYVQSLLFHGFRLAKGIIFAADESTYSAPDIRKGSNPRDRGAGRDRVFVPDLDRKLIPDVYELCDRVEVYTAKTINSLEVVSAIRRGVQDGLKWAVYSGIGGQIVEEKVLRAGVRIIHAHPGSLPKFKGSTTIYYSLLALDCCPVSLIQLKTGIDNGPVLSREVYPRPRYGIDIDNVYDNMIRADLIAKYLAGGSRKMGTVAGEQKSCPALGKDQNHHYYVIHPVLKHIAIAALDLDTEDQSVQQSD